MSGEKLSADLVKHVQERTGQEDVEEGVWQLIYLSRGRHEIDAGQ
jgi:hypothetical protein